MELEASRVDLRQQVARSIEALTTGNQVCAVPVTHQVTDRVPAAVLLDGNRFNQVLTNLVGNAIKFTRRGNISVILDARTLEGGRLCIETKVQDTGIGIPSEKLDSIFGTFSQADNSFVREYGGTGLGLAISRQLVQLMGGSIHVKSKEGRGSVFTFTVPAQAVASGNQPLVSDGPVLPTPPSAERRLRVLVVEDNPVNSRFVERYLEKRGHAVEVAGHGKLGLNAFMARTFDLILMDVQMPIMDGLQATEAIREWEGSGPARVTVVGLTAHASAEDRSRCLAAGMDGYLTKPVKLADLDKVLAKVMNQELIPA
jgi:CheY-like chemotaxis protein